MDSLQEYVPASNELEASAAIGWLEGRAIASGRMSVDTPAGEIASVLMRRGKSATVRFYVCGQLVGRAAAERFLSVNSDALAVVNGCSTPASPAA